jgi:hypothetical protein
MSFSSVSQSTFSQLNFLFVAPYPIIRIDFKKEFQDSKILLPV